MSLLSSFLFLFFAFLFHLLFPLISDSNYQHTVLITLRYYFILLQHALYSTFLFHLLFCLNYTSLLLYLIITRLASHLSLSSIIFITSDTNYTSLLLHPVIARLASYLSFSSIIFIISDTNYTSLLLHLVITHLVNTFYNKYVINICPR